jgi:hypothetical protein
MNAISAVIGSVATLLPLSLALAQGASPPAASPGKTITCPYLQADPITFDVPAKRGDLPAIDFDYPSKVTRFRFADGRLLLVAVDEVEPSRRRVFISARLNKAKGSYDGKLFVDMGGNQLQFYRGRVICTLGPSPSP